MNARKKGIGYIREVRKILEGMGAVVWGPGYKPMWIKSGSMVVHEDYFNIWDLISYQYGHYEFHQVSTLHNKSAKIKAIQTAGMPGWVWSRVDNPIGYRIFKVDSAGNVAETEMMFVAKAIQPTT